jgi:hypothetical protein
MSNFDFEARIRASLCDIDAPGLTKPERALESSQGPLVRLRDGAGQARQVLNMCANDCLGLAAGGTGSEFVISPAAGHQWLDEILARDVECAIKRLGDKAELA